LHAKQAFVAFFAPRFATFGMQFGDKKQEAKQASRRRSFCFFATLACAAASAEMRAFVLLLRFLLI
jgi:hypothetical protein